MSARALILWAPLATALLSAIGPVDVERSPYPYVVSTPDRAYYFKMSPDPNDPQDRDKGGGYCFKARVGREDALLWSTSGWYAYEVFLAPDGKHVVRLGNPPRGYVPSSAHLAVAFYESGQLLKSYSTEELIRDASHIPRTLEHYSFLGEPPPRFVAEPTVLDEALSFRLVTSDRVEYVFDAHTGAISSSRQL